MAQKWGNTRHVVTVPERLPLSKDCLALSSRFQSFFKLSQKSPLLLRFPHFLLVFLFFFLSSNIPLQLSVFLSQLFALCFQLSTSIIAHPQTTLQPLFSSSHFSTSVASSPLSFSAHPFFLPHVFSVQLLFSHKLLPAPLPAQIIISSGTLTTTMARWSHPRLCVPCSCAWKSSPTPPNK